MTKAGVEKVKVKARVTDKTLWLDASDEEQAVIAGYGVEIDDKGYFKEARVPPV
jgi:hypothetical protein